MIRGRVLVHESMARHTTFRIGGPADLFVQPLDGNDLGELIRFARAKGLPFKVIGNGSNLLVGDGGIRGIVARLAPNFSEVEWLEDGAVVGGGARLARLVKEAGEVGLSGLESTVGIPGTLGGALATNAGTDTGSISDLVVAATVLDEAGELREWTAAQFAYRYRYSSLGTSKATVVLARLRLEPAATEDIRAKVDRLRAKRAGRQPLRAWSAGSVFKNERAVAAGKVLDRAGAKGHRIGEAQVSRKHANFFINRGRATAEAMRELIAWSRARALRRYGISLELEIELVGE
ncbi:MAG TPA: UDP-N-acetylmuramate dehydrogenase [Armatimonadota bacterium]|nr:UDP-N-acetylmuramate dehydrogenase [Armatimonadota bacterium]